jgi:MerR family Zn(II)-responsive transcriptional regulator of zntA
MYTIGKLARLARVKADNIRFYERVGLIVPTRKTESGYRLYTEDALRRIDLIKHAKRCGFSLVEIRELLQLRDGEHIARGDISRFLSEKQAEIEKTISAATSMSSLISELLSARAAASADPPLAERERVANLAAMPRRTPMRLHEGSGGPG